MEWSTLLCLQTSLPVILDHVSQTIFCLLKQSTLPLGSAAGKEVLLCPSQNFPLCLFTGKEHYLFVHSVFKFRKAIMASLFTHLSQTVLSHFSDPLTVPREWDAGWVLTEWNVVRPIQRTPGPLPFWFPQDSMIFFCWVRRRECS